MSKKQGGIASKLIYPAIFGAVMSLGATGAYAAETASGTTISNLATLNYAVGGVNQTAIGSSAAGNTTGAGTATTFVVDNKVNLTLIETSTTPTSVVPGSTAQVTTFTLTNTGNTSQGYTFVAANLTGTTVFTVADTIDVSNLQVFVDSNGNGIYDAGVDTATAVSSLAQNASVKVFVLGDVPVSATNGAQAAVSLTATTTTVNTATAVVETTGADTAGVDIVFADPSTTANANNTDPGQVARDAKAVANDAYRVASAVISVQKTATVLCDPFNGTTNPKNIPGAIIRWTITVSNSATAGASATLSQVADALDTNTTFDPNLVAPTSAATCSSASGTPESAAGKGVKLDVTGDTRTGTYPKYLTNAADSDGSTFSSPNETVTYTQAMPAEGTYAAGELKPGEAAVVYFNVTIN